MQYWGNHPDWQSLSDLEKAATMAMMEAGIKGGRPDPVAAKNALGAMINRADRDGEPLGKHVSRKIYQPTIEPSQFKRLKSLGKDPLHADLMGFAERRLAGQEPDPVQGATHFLAHPDLMLALEAKNPRKYRSWRKWTGFDQENKRYANQVTADRSHAFLAPEGIWSAAFETQAPMPEKNPMFHDVGPDFEPEAPRNPSLVMDLPEGVEGELGGNLMPQRNPAFMGMDPEPRQMPPPAQEAPRNTMIAMPEKRDPVAVAGRPQTQGRTEDNPWANLQNWPGTDNAFAGQAERPTMSIGHEQPTSFYDDTIKPTLLNALSNIKFGGMGQPAPDWVKRLPNWPGAFK